MLPKTLFQFNRQIKMPQNKVHRPKYKINIPQRKPLKTYLWTGNGTKMRFCILFSQYFPGPQTMKIMSLYQKEVFLVFIILLCISDVQKTIEMYLTLHLGSYFPQIPGKCWNLTHIKNSLFNTIAKLKCHKLQYFSQTAKLKCREIYYLG